MLETYPINVTSKTMKKLDSLAEKLNAHTGRKAKRSQLIRKAIYEFIENINAGDPRNALYENEYGLYSVRLRPETLKEIDEIIEQYPSLKLSKNKIIRLALDEFIETFKEGEKYLHYEPGKKPENILVDLVRIADGRVFESKEGFEGWADHDKKESQIQDELGKDEE